MLISYLPPPSAGADDISMGSRGSSRSRIRVEGRGGNLRRCSSGVPSDLLASVKEMKVADGGAGGREDRLAGIASVMSRVLRKGKSAYG